jgi:hypothetical protein
MVDDYLSRKNISFTDFAVGCMDKFLREEDNVSIFDRRIQSMNGDINKLAKAVNVLSTMFSVFATHMYAVIPEVNSDIVEANDRGLRGIERLKRQAANELSAAGLTTGDEISDMVQKLSGNVLTISEN